MYKSAVAYAAGKGLLDLQSYERYELHSGPSGESLSGFPQEDAFKLCFERAGAPAHSDCFRHLGPYAARKFNSMCICGESCNGGRRIRGRG